MRTGVKLFKHIIKIIKAGANTAKILNTLNYNAQILFTNVIILNNVFNRINASMNRIINKITPVRTREVKIIKTDINKKDLTGIKVIKD